MLNHRVLGGDSTSQLTCGRVRFTPGARTRWHSHVNGRLLVCTDGIGLVGTRDAKTRNTTAAPVLQLVSRVADPAAAAIS
jgi:quercetin dioxygenase-like cupin family protein